MFVALLITLLLIIFSIKFINLNIVKDIGSFLGGAFAGIGTIFAILLTISFTKKSISLQNELTIQPFLQVENIKKDSFLVKVEDTAFYKYNNFNDNVKVIKYNKKAETWIETDEVNHINGDTIKKLKTACFLIKNVGLSTARNINISFETSYIEKKDHGYKKNHGYKLTRINLGSINSEFALMAGEEIYLVLVLDNFNDTSFKMEISCESLRGRIYIRTYRFGLTCHKDRTNITFYGDSYKESVEYQNTSK